MTTNSDKGRDRADPTDQRERETSATACTVCKGPLNTPVYISAEPFRITSMCQVYPGRTYVYCCSQCGHLITPPLQDLANFYEQEYRMLIDTEDEDQLYAVQNGIKKYRYDHQIETLLRKVKLTQGARVLDFGCARGAMLQRLLKIRPDIVGCLFDVSSMYLPFWERLCTPSRWAIHHIPDQWKSSFDLVMTFFVLEHLDNPRQSVQNIADVLRPGSTLYLIVPNVFANIGDFVVTDHVNHFTPASLRCLLTAAGFSNIVIDEQAHSGAFVVQAIKAPPNEPPRERGVEVGKVVDKAAEMAKYWGKFASRIRELEVEHKHAEHVSIYGSSFYGTFLHSCLQEPDRVACFIDQNPHRWSKTHMGKTIVPPEKLPEVVNLIYVALNPAVAREQELERIPAWQDRSLSFLYP